MSVLIAILITFHVLVCLLLVGVVLMQRLKNVGLGEAFGGGMTENMFGDQTTHVLQKFTVWLGVVFFALTLLLAILYAKRGTGETAIQKELLAQPIPVASPAAPATTPAPPTTAPAPAPEATAEPTATPAPTPTATPETPQAKPAAKPEDAKQKPQGRPAKAD